MDTHVNSEEENISEVGACAAHNFETRKKLRTTNIESLPNDVVFDILARVPARDIYYGARLVCSNWYQTIRTHDFMHAHLQRSTCSRLVIQRFGSSERDYLKFATQKGPIIEIMSDIDYKFTGYILSSCNGLILERDHSDKKSGLEIRITNPATKQHFVLQRRNDKFVGMGLAYAAASKEYKAVRTRFIYPPGEPECAILTVGVDEDWKRRVDIRHLSPSAKNLLAQTPLTTDGFVHWAPRYGSGWCDSEIVVVTLNVETEIITQFPSGPPGFCERWGYYITRYSYLSMGRCLSLLIARVDNMCAIWDQVWVMEPETGEWTKMMSIHSESLKRALQGIDSFYSFYWPVGWLKCREVLFFASSGSSHCFAYNVRTHEIESFELGFIPDRFVAHQNSLVWLDGC